MNVAIFGGSFDPPHVCHVLAAAWALSTQEIDRVVAVPCFDHPFDKALSPFEVRLAMARLAFAIFHDRVEVSSVEEELGKPSFTARTVGHLSRLHPDWQLRLLVGADILEEKERWHRFEDIERLAPPLVVGREGRKGSLPGRIVLPDVSSTQVRSMLRSGSDVSELVPHDVLDYVLRQGIYLNPMVH